MSAGDVAAALLEAPGSPNRRKLLEYIERQVQRALWRAERRGRRLPFDVRQGASWVHAQRRKIAHELARAVGSLGAGKQLALQIATDACARFPRDGVVVHDFDSRRPRDRGDAPRQQGKNPRARGASPRQLGRSPRQQRTAGEAIAAPAAAAPSSSSADVCMSNDDVHTSRPGELPREWYEQKERIREELAPHERANAGRQILADRERLNRSRNPHHPSTTATRS